MLEVLAQQKDIVITFDNRVTASVYVYLDIRLFKQIIINLLSNAIKFTAKGSIEFVLVQSSGGLELTIQDSGIGISPHNLSKLFSEFSQIKEKKQTQEKGSGLGLAISKKLSRLFDADLLLESDGEGLGTRAIVYLTRNMH
jgi:signal transduction histidine kinase